MRRIQIARKPRFTRDGPRRRLRRQGQLGQELALRLIPGILSFLAKRNRCMEQSLTVGLILNGGRSSVKCSENEEGVHCRGGSVFSYGTGYSNSAVSLAVSNGTGSVF